MSATSHPKSINFSRALKTVQQASSSLQLQAERIELCHANGRVLSETISAPINVPQFDCSRMDGYGINSDVLINSKGNQLKIGAAVYAGESPVFDEPHEYGALAVPVMTGSVLPPWVNAVVIKEHAIVEAGMLKVDRPVQKRQNIRSVGSDVTEGQVVLKKSHALSIADMGLLSSLGLSHVAVYKKPKVALVMTGDELVEPGKSCDKGQVFDSNSLMLSKLLEQIGCHVELLKILKDEQSLIDKQFKALQSESFDMVVSVGGVSMGDKDYMPSVLASNGEILFHKTHIKPGFPMLFGQLGGALFFGLPGNPVSAFTTLFQFVYPAILCAFQLNKQTPLIWRAELLQDFTKSHMKREFVRGRYSITSEGKVEVSVCGGQQSSRMKSLAEANCFIVLNESQQDIAQGERVSIQPFNQLSNLSD